MCSGNTIYSAIFVLDGETMLYKGKKIENCTDSTPKRLFYWIK